MNLLGLKLKEARYVLGLQQPEMAKKLGCSVRTLSSWETGATRPKGAALLRIAEALSMGIHDLVGEDKSNIRNKVQNNIAGTPFTLNGKYTYFEQNTDTFEPTIPKNSIVVIDTMGNIRNNRSNEMFDGEIYLLSTKNSTQLGRVQFLPNDKIKLIYDNKSYESVIYDFSELAFKGIARFTITKI